MRITVNIPEAVNGDFEIKKVTTDFVANRSEPLDTYTVLYMDGISIMQDTTHEYMEHRPLWDNATGHVLIGGLGIGFVNQKLIDNPNVTSVTIVEKYQEVIDLTWPHCPKDDKFTLIHDDVVTWEPTQHFDVGWFDTWISPWGPYSEYNEILYGRYINHCDKLMFWSSIGG
ncbi:MAG: hypothetical protein QF704_08565 [Anaerolineales bacterium]|jgi:hypothetical protein|nr:hypothetical protein [Anaerolineales bacterium]